MACVTRICMVLFRAMLPRPPLEDLLFLSFFPLRTLSPFVLYHTSTPQNSFVKSKTRSGWRVAYSEAQGHHRCPKGEVKKKKARFVEWRTTTPSTTLAWLTLLWCKKLWRVNASNGIPGGESEDSSSSKQVINRHSLSSSSTSHSKNGRKGVLEYRYWHSTQKQRFAKYITRARACLSVHLVQTLLVSRYPLTSEEHRTRTRKKVRKG